MPPEAVSLRRATRVALAVAVVALGGLAVLFGIVLHRVPPDRCVTGLYPGPYADALVPAHLAAFAVLSCTLAWLATVRAGDGRPPRRAVGGLGAVALLAVVGAAWPPMVAVVAFAALVVAVPVGGFLALAGGLRAIATAREAGLDPAERWRRHALLAEAALWIALVLALPAVFAAAWLNGAGLFCF